VIGVTIAEAPRRGHIYTTAPELTARTIAANLKGSAAPAQGAPITAENYGRVADDMRRSLRVAQVVCLTN